MSTVSKQLDIREVQKISRRVAWAREILRANRPWYRRFQRPRRTVSGWHDLCDETTVLLNVVQSRIEKFVSGLDSIDVAIKREASEGEYQVMTSVPYGIRIDVTTSGLSIQPERVYFPGLKKSRMNIDYNLRVAKLYREYLERKKSQGFRFRYVVVDGGQGAIFRYIQFGW